MPSYEMFDPEEAKKDIKEGGVWIQLGEGDEARVAIVGKSYRREVVWLGSHGETYNPEDPTHVKFLNTLGKDGKPNKVTVRHAVNVVLKHESEPQYSVRILELAPTHFKGMVARIQRFGADKWFDIQRTGSGSKDTRYDFDPAGEITAEDQAAFETLDFYDLEEFYAKKKANGDTSFEFGANAE